MGTGHFGKVYLGSLDNTNHTLIAVKMSQQVNLSNESETRRQYIEEIKIMRMVGNHPNLVSLIGYCIQPDKPICILLEYMQGGDLLTYLHLKKKNETSKIIQHNENTLRCSSKPNISKSKHSIIKFTASFGHKPHNLNFQLYILV